MESKEKKTVVIKLGSATVGCAESNEGNLSHLVDQIAELFNMGHRIVLVTSGAVSTGMKALHIGRRPSNIIDRQALAATGQGYLIHNYQIMFAKHKIVVAQLLLTRLGLEDRERYLNARNTLIKLMEWRILPIINENDSVAVEELCFGDNDELSALVAVKIAADLLMLVTTADGVLIQDPGKKGNKKLLKEIDLQDSQLESSIGGSASECGTGGMKTKIKAAKMAALCGTTAVIINGLRSNTIVESFSGQCTGTICRPPTPNHKLSSKKRWLALGISSTGKEIHVDEGASKAILKTNSSLLASGIRYCSGEFKRGDIVQIYDSSGREIAKGLVNYNSDELFKIQGRQSKDFTRILGYPRQEEVVHRDNMIVVEKI
ncbi:MAG: glutamate 5-kinase [bacterium]